MLATLALGSSWVGAAPETQLDYKNFSGLSLSLGGVPVVTGSSFQYYEKGWSKGYYSSAWKPVDIARLGDGRLQVRFSGSNGEAVGTHTITERPNGFDVDYLFVWRGDKPVRLESSFARLWAPFFENGSVVLDGIETGPLNRPVRTGTLRDARFYNSGAKEIRFLAPSATITVTSDRPVQLMDARNYGVEWAKDQELFWLGATELDIAPQETIQFRQSWTIEPRLSRDPAPYAPEGEFVSSDSVESPGQNKNWVIPTPKQMELSSTYKLVGKNWEFKGMGLKAVDADDFRALLAKWWDLETVSERATEVECRIGNLGLPAQGYRIRIGEQIEVVGQDSDGVRNGLMTLIQLVQRKNQELVIPKGQVVDYPSLNWRGVHMFVGPSALDFQTRLMQSVLSPLKFNKIVLQCERTSWDAIRGTETKITMPKSDLIALNGRYKDRGFEVIPLVQSLGHAGWLFENKQNLDIAINPEVPFTLDPRKARARQLLKDLWQEVGKALSPQTVHFGMDEVDMRGMKVDPSFTDRLIAQHMPFLNSIAKDLNARPMIWGDMMLHTSEAIDAANAPSLEAAKSRRKSIKPGTMIADWHYKDDSDPANHKSLRLWQREGMYPVASGWFRPKNILGNVQAVKAVGGGYLQTTWAGYESGESQIIKGFEQFAAYVLAGEYAWSGRNTEPEDLPFDPGDVLRDRYFALPKVVKPVSGEFFGTGSQFRIGDFQFRALGPFQLKSVVSREAFMAPDRLVFKLGKPVRKIALACGVLARVSETEEVGKVLIKFGNGKRREFPIQYGVHLRSRNDMRATAVSDHDGARSAVILDLGSEQVVEEIVVQRTGMSAGLNVIGVSLLK